MLRISTTTLESFRLFMEPEQEWMPESELLKTIRGEFVPDHKVIVGKNFDAILERPEQFKVDGGYACGGSFFPDAVMQHALAVFDRRGVWQVKGTNVYPPDCLVVAKADQLIGGRLVENKTTLSSFDFDKYAASCQWRFMADIFQPAVITYNVFLLGEKTDGTFDLRGIEAFNLYPYDGLHRDCVSLVGRFYDYVTTRGLDGLLRERQVLAEAQATA